MNTSEVEIPYKSGAFVHFCENAVTVVKYTDYFEQIHQKINKLGATKYKKII